MSDENLIKLYIDNIEEVSLLDIRFTLIGTHKTELSLQRKHKRYFHNAIV